MIAIIPAKAHSERVPNKNYRQFYGGKSLVDLTAEKLLRVLPARDIYLSCEDPDKEAVASRHGIRFLPRNLHFADNRTPMAEYVQGISAEVPGDADVMWCHVTDPMFNDYVDVVAMWDAVKSGYDSLVVVRPFREYILDQNFNPIGFGFGPWHVMGQRLPEMYRLTFGCSVLSRKAIAKAGYMVGARPCWFPSTGRAVDIDTEDDFEFAQLLYERKVRCESA